MVRIGDFAVLVGTLVVFAFSFAPFVQYDDQTRELYRPIDVSMAFSAWSLETFMMPLTLFVIGAAVLTAISTVLRFVLARDPQVAGFRLRQLEVGMALFTTLVLLGMVSSSKHPVVGTRRLAETHSMLSPTDVSLKTGWGSILMLLGALLLLTGALLNHFNVGPAIPLTGQPGGAPAAAWQVGSPPGGAPYYPGQPPAGPPYPGQPPVPGQHPGPGQPPAPGQYPGWQPAPGGHNQPGHPGPSQPWHPGQPGA